MTTAAKSTTRKRKRRTTTPSRRLTRMATVSDTNTRPDGPILTKLRAFYVPGEPCPANVLLASPPSFGKSYSIRELGREYDAYLEHGCSDDLDEIATLLGSPIPDGKGHFVVADGVLTEAMRHAAAGQTTLLLLDEVLRLNSRAQEWLLSFLTGVKMSDGRREYHLRTRHVRPDGSLEVITCDARNLHIVAATNLSLISPIEAFWSRWEVVRIEFSATLVASVARSILDAYGISADAKRERSRLASLWARVMRDTRIAVGDGKLRYPADLRMLERAAALATAPTASAVAQLLLDRLTDNVANWNPDTGDTEAESVKTTEQWVKLITTAFPDAAPPATAVLDRTTTNPSEDGDDDE